LAPGEYGYVGLGWKDKFAGRKVVFGITGSLIFYGNSGMPKVLETKLKRKARKMGLGKQEQQLIRNSLINIESE